MRRWFPDYEDPDWETEYREVRGENPGRAGVVDFGEQSVQPGAAIASDDQPDAPVLTGKTMNLLGQWWPRTPAA